MTSGGADSNGFHAHQRHAERSPDPSNAQALGDRSIAIMRHAGIEVDVIRAIDHEIATGVYTDMTEHGWERDEWPEPGSQ